MGSDNQMNGMMDMDMQGMKEISYSKPKGSRNVPQPKIQQEPQEEDYGDDDGGMDLLQL